jgi:hypothetical protein
MIANIALKLLASICPFDMWIYVGFTSLTSNRTIWTEIDNFDRGLMVNTCSRNGIFKFLFKAFQEEANCKNKKYFGADKPHLMAIRPKVEV